MQRYNIDENELDVKEEKRCSRGHETPHSILGKEIRHYFPDLEDFQKYCRFVKNPFGTSVGDLPSQDNLLQEQFIDLVNDGNARRLMALKVLIPFPTTYAAFSALLAIKPKARNRLDAIHNIEGCVVQNGTKHSGTDSTEASAPVTSIP